VGKHPPGLASLTDFTEASNLPSEASPRSCAFARRLAHCSRALHAAGGAVRGAAASAFPRQPTGFFERPSPCAASHRASRLISALHLSLHPASAPDSPPSPQVLASATLPALHRPPSPSRKRPADKAFAPHASPPPAAQPLPPPEPEREPPPPLPSSALLSPPPAVKKRRSSLAPASAFGRGSGAKKTETPLTEDLGGEAPFSPPFEKQPRSPVPFPSLGLGKVRTNLVGAGGGGRIEIEKSTPSPHAPEDCENRPPSAPLPAQMPLPLPLRPPAKAATTVPLSCPLAPEVGPAFAAEFAPALERMFMFPRPISALQKHKSRFDGAGDIGLQRPQPGSLAALRTCAGFVGGHTSFAAPPARALQLSPALLAGLARIA